MYYVCMNVDTSIYVYLYTPTYIYIYICIHIYIYMCTHKLVVVEWLSQS